jgi:hypothetical protein
MSSVSKIGDARVKVSSKNKREGEREGEMEKDKERIS